MTTEKLKLEFYKQPFHIAKYGGWVYDAKDNFVFQFEGDFDVKGNYKKGYKELCQKIIDCLNDNNSKPIESLELELKNAIEIYKEGKLFILIRGWGNLTGIGAHNFSSDKASKIQDDFVSWFLSRVSANCH